MFCDGKRALREVGMTGFRGSAALTETEEREFAYAMRPNGRPQIWSHQEVETEETKKKRRLR